jgi:hypothetical protein
VKLYLPFPDFGKNWFVPSIARSCIDQVVEYAVAVDLAGMDKNHS